jgi:tyrosyl-tRNA synthetase
MTQLPLQDVAIPAEGLRIAALLTAAGLTPSNSEANRKLKERAVKVDGEVVEDGQQVLQPGFEGLLQVGKRLSPACAWSPPDTSGNGRRQPPFLIL